MEPVIFSESPLAEYLEGHGEADTNFVRVSDISDADPTSEASFAPRGRTMVRSNLRERLHHFRSRTSKRQVLYNVSSQIAHGFKAGLSAQENQAFLERFRYLIIGSQLLNEEVSHTRFDIRTRSRSPERRVIDDAVETVSVSGVAITAGGAFCFAWLIHWICGASQTLDVKRVALVAVVAGISILGASKFLQRQWIKILRHDAIEATSTFVENTEGFDVATSAAITFIQEVELVSRGYRISPMPPISRLESQDPSQRKRCATLRKAVLQGLKATLKPHADAVKELRRYANANDLERFYEVYEINAADVDEVIAEYVPHDGEDMESLKVLKMMFYRLRATRKIMLCCLLSVGAEGTNTDLDSWKAVVSQLETLGTVAGARADKIREIFDEQENVPTPPSPSTPVAGFEKRKAQIRKLNSLAQSLRGLQAKMYALRDETDKSLEDTNEIEEYGSSLLTQYDAIGADLQFIMKEWESGKAALAQNIDKTEKRLSQTSNGLRSPVISWSGATLSGDSPSDALRALNGEIKGVLNIEDVPEASEEDEERVYEAVAIPRSRSTLTREERIQKMREGREQAAAKHSSLDENSRMMRELKSVINLRPRGKTASAPKSSMPV